LPGSGACRIRQHAWRYPNLAVRRLQGIVGPGTLQTAALVLTKQNRLSRLAEQRAE